MGDFMQIARILAGATLALALTVPHSALAQEPKESPATFNERYPVEETATQQTATQPPAESTNANKQQNVETPTGAVRPAQQNATARTRATTAPRARTRVVVVRRSFLDAGTQVIPLEERKFLDYAFPPLHQPYNVVTNIGGRVGWHNSPLPGPFFPTTN
jgi:hypothetical protein